MTYPFYILIGILPSIIWLLFYLRKDVHPESNLMILKIFILGMVVSIPVILVENGFYTIILGFSLSPTIALILNAFLGIALTEEIFKYFVVKYGVLPSPELDEPIDILLYMIIAALGLAASENILLLFRVHPLISFPETLSLTAVHETLSLIAIRFIGATFLHVLCSGLIGFFLALSIFEIKNRLKFISLGIGIAVLLHGLYDFFIMTMDRDMGFTIPISILAGLAIFVSLSFRKLQKMKSICKIK